MIQIESLAIPEVKCLTLFHASDTRGEFIKAFNFTYLSSQNIDFQLKESIYSTSNLNVLIFCYDVNKNIALLFNMFF